LAATIDCSQREELNLRIKEFTKTNNFIEKIYYKKEFNIFTLQKILNSEKPLRIYVEGDGFAYANRYRASIDPTPKTTFLFELMTQDNSVNLLYISRPCQYVSNEKCQQKYWTSERFSSEVIAAISEVVDEFKDHEIELVGYSGGAMIALQLQQKNIKNIRTIAGNLDLDEFVKTHKISPLETAKINYERLSKIPQIHFIGAADKVIPPQIFIEYQKKLTQKNCVKMKIIEGATHGKNWQEKWSDLVNSRVFCS
jgi:hypothetical protein